MGIHSLIPKEIPGIERYTGLHKAKSNAPICTGKHRTPESLERNHRWSPAEPSIPVSEADRQRATQKSEIASLRENLRTKFDSQKEYQEANAALQAITERTRKQEQAIRMKRLQRDIEATNEKSPKKDFQSAERKNPVLEKSNGKQAKNSNRRPNKQRGKKAKTSRQDAEILKLLRLLRK